MKKIPQIDGCHHCPLRIKNGVSSIGRPLYFCDIRGLDISTYVNEFKSIHPECELPEDN